MILVIDDDPRIRSAVTKLLIEQAYQVTACDGGTAALEALSANPSVSLLISDVLMPGMNGPALVRQAKAVRPDLAILFMSGDVGDTPASDFAGYELLTKPFTPSALIAAVSRAINAQRP
jgi:CheY-like chemotaxis protein